MGNQGQPQWLMNPKQPSGQSKMHTLQHDVSFDRNFAQTQLQMLKQESSSLEAKKARNLLNAGINEPLNALKNTGSVHNSHDLTTSGHTTQNTYYMQARGVGNHSGLDHARPPLKSLLTSYYPD